MIAHLCDHSVRIWRRTTSKGEYREDNVTLVATSAAPTVMNAKVNRSRTRVGDAGPGLTPIGERTLYMDTEADVQERDILQLVTGPDAPALLEVDAEPTRPRGHHLEITCRIWHGKLPGES